MSKLKARCIRHQMPIWRCQNFPARPDTFRPFFGFSEKKKKPRCVWSRFEGLFGWSFPQTTPKPIESLCYRPLFFSLTSRLFRQLRAAATFFISRPSASSAFSFSWLPFRADPCKLAGECEVGHMIEEGDRSPRTVRY
jgi:hypothetical protein